MNYGLVRAEGDPGSWLPDDTMITRRYRVPSEADNIADWLVKKVRMMVDSNEASDRQRYYQQFMAQEFYQCRQSGFWRDNVYINPDPNQDSMFYQVDKFSPRVRILLLQWLQTMIDLTVYSGEDSAKGAAAARAGHTWIDWFMQDQHSPIDELTTGLRAILQGSYLFETYFDPTIGDFVEVPEYGMGMQEIDGAQYSAMQALGTKKYRKGQVVSVTHDPIEWTFHPSARAMQPKTAPWIYQRRRALIPVLESIYWWAEIKRLQPDKALRYQMILEKRVGAFTGASGTSAGSHEAKDQTNLERAWLDPCDYSNVFFKKETVFRNDVRVPAGTPLVEVFPDGIYAAVCGGELLDIWPEDKKKRLAGGVYWVVPSSANGLGVVSGIWQAKLGNDAYNMMIEALRYIIAPQRLFNASILDSGQVYYGNFNRQVPVYNMDPREALDKLMHVVPGGEIPVSVMEFLKECGADMDTVMDTIDMMKLMSGRNGDKNFQVVKEQINARAGLPGVVKGYVYSMRGQQAIELFQKYGIFPQKYSTKIMGDYSRYEVRELSQADVRGDLIVGYEENSTVPRSPGDRQANLVKAISAGAYDPQQDPEVRKQLSEAFQVPYTGDKMNVQRRKCQIRIDEILKQYEKMSAFMAQDPAAAMEFMQPDPMTGVPFAVSAILSVAPNPQADTVGTLIETESDNHDIFIEEIQSFINSDKGIYADALLKEVMTRRMLEHRVARSTVQQAVSAEAAYAQMPQLETAQALGQGMGGTPLPVDRNVMPEGQLTPQPKPTPKPS